MAKRKIAIGTTLHFEQLVKIEQILIKAGWEVINLNKNRHLIYLLDVASEIAALVYSKQVERGIILEDTGQGGFLIANKCGNNVVAPLYDEYSAAFAMKHNNANIIVLATNLTTWEIMKRIIHLYISTDFDAGRHLVRTDMLDEMLKGEDNENSCG